MKLKIVERVYDEEYEVEGMFLNGQLLDFWSLNDGHWRDEYFGPFMKKLGIKVRHSEDPHLIQALRDHIKAMYE